MNLFFGFLVEFLVDDHCSNGNEFIFVGVVQYQKWLAEFKQRTCGNSSGEG